MWCEFNATRVLRAESEHVSLDSAVSMMNFLRRFH